MNLAEYIQYLMSIGLSIEFSKDITPTITISDREMYIVIDNYYVDRIEFACGQKGIDTKKVVLLIARAEELIKLLKEGLGNE